MSLRVCKEILTSVENKEINNISFELSAVAEKLDDLVTEYPSLFFDRSLLIDRVVVTRKKKS